MEIQGADGETKTVLEWCQIPKNQLRALMLRSLSAAARRVYACAELHTMGFQREEAVVMKKVNGKVGIFSMTPHEMGEETGLSKENFRRSMAELEEAGFGERKGTVKGDVRLIFWADPHPPKEKNGSRALTTIPAWVPKSWDVLVPLIKRFKYKLPETMDENGSRALTTILAEGERAAQEYERAEMVVVRFLDGICAPARSNNEERTERTKTKESSSSPDIDYTPSPPLVLDPEPQTTTTSALTFEEPAPEPEPEPEPAPPKPQPNQGVEADPVLAALSNGLTDLLSQSGLGGTPNKRQIAEISASLPKPTTLDMVNDYLLWLRRKIIRGKLKSIGGLPEFTREFTRGWIANVKAEPPPKNGIDRQRVIEIERILSDPNTPEDEKVLARIALGP